MIARATSDDESTSPMPTRPASVWTLTTRVSWLPSQRSLTSGRRRWIGSTRVIFIAGYSFGLAVYTLRCYRHRESNRCEAGQPRHAVEVGIGSGDLGQSVRLHDGDGQGVIR